MLKIDFKNTALKCWQNGERLLNDAISLSDGDSFPSAFALSIIAQEEFAKSLIFIFIRLKIIPWHPLIKRSLADHTCKQLIGLVIEHLTLLYDDPIEVYSGDRIEKSYNTAIDAILILRFEKLDKWETSNLFFVVEPGFDRHSKSIFKGKLEKSKQDSLYIRINNLGKIVSDPSEVNYKQAEDMISKAKRYSKAIEYLLKKEEKHLFEFDKIKEAFKIWFQKYDTFNQKVP